MIASTKGRHIMTRFIPYFIHVISLVSVASLQAGLHAQQVVINEIMFAPAAGAAEWVELYNPGPVDRSIRGWTLRDRSGGTAILSTEEFMLPAGGYLIVASAIPLAPGWESLPSPVVLPSDFPSLNNGGDDLVLCDDAGGAVDSVSYAGSWSPQRGVSAERIRFDIAPRRENWAACTMTGGGTPGQQNSASLPPPESLPRFSLIINELMPSPLPESCEWIELFNPTQDSIAITRWSLAGKTDSRGNRPRISLPSDAGAVPPSGFAVIAADSSALLEHPDLASADGVLVLVLGRSSLELGNSDDELLLCDAAGNVIDSIWYREEWHHPLLSSSEGVSLELMHPAFHHLGGDAWSSCAAPEGGTPGMCNSIYSDLPPQSGTDGASVSVTPNPFSPDGDGFEDHCLFRCTLPANVNQVRLRIYDAEGRPIATLRNNQPMGREAMVVWDGLDDAGRRTRVGAYVALLEGLDPYANTVVVTKAVVVVARKL
jgi:hypothetical protein